MPAGVTAIADPDTAIVTVLVTKEEELAEPEAEEGEEGEAAEGEAADGEGEGKRAEGESEAAAGE